VISVIRNAGGLAVDDSEELAAERDVDEDGPITEPDG
jgi:hypothetical protein